MKILVISNYYYPDFVGGAEKSSQLLAEEFVKKGNDVLVFTSKHATETNVNGIPVVRADLGKFDIDIRLNCKGTLWNKFKNKVYEINNKAIYPQLKNAIDSFKPDVVFTNNLYGLSSIVWKCVGDSQIPLVHTVHDYWIFGCRPKILSLFHRSFYRKRSDFVDCVIAPTPSAMAVVSKNKSFFRFARHAVISNGADFDIPTSKRIVLRKMDNLKNWGDGPLNLIFVGRLSKHKGLLNLLTALDYVKIDYKIHICGDGPLRDKVIENSMSNSRIVYHGNLGKEELYRVYSECDVLVAPSLCSETFGLVIIEAMLNGCCVIGSNFGGINDIVNRVRGGQTIDPYSVSDISNTINQLRPDKMVLWLKNIYDFIENYHISHVADDYLKAFDGAIAKKSPIPSEGKKWKP